MKHKKRLFAILGALSLMLVLAGCSADTPVTQHSTGFWDHYIVWSGIKIIKWLSAIFGNNYGWGIIIFTIIIRIIILPLMIYQIRSSRKTMEIQPQLKALQKKYSSKDTESVRKLREEQQKLYAEAGVNPVAGCLPVIIQLPILWALYQAIYRSPILKTGHFLWMQLGDKDPLYILPILAALFTLLTSWLSAKSQLESNMMMTMMTFGMPVMIFVIAVNMPAAVSLYWVISNIFSAGQTFIFNNPFKIQKERQEKITQEKRRKRQLEKAKRKALKRK